MALITGMRLGPYEILAPIGRGGMGEVYRARDAALRRDVAIKVLPGALAGDADRLARLRREAEALAALNHPNIAQIYGIEQASPSPALVLELVEGPTLAERLATGPLPVGEALAAARQIAEALEAAHERGIIHRDLKPANVKLREDGTVKLLDFGLAKALGSGSPATADDGAAEFPTVSAHATQAGVVLGTAAYMSPEQARGRTADRRADVWALGVVLFEMLTGRRLFDGETVSEILAAVIKDEPSFEGLPADLPPQIRHLLVRCLRKEPRLRLQAAGDARLLIEEVQHPHLAGEVAVAREAPRAARISGTVPWLLAGVLAIVSGVLLLRPDRADPRPAGLAERYSINLPEDRPLAPTSGPLLAACGGANRLVYSARLGDGIALFVKRPDQLHGVPIAGTENGSQPFCSRDGDEVAFFRENALFKVSLAGGEAIRLASQVSPRGGAWFGDTIVFAGTLGGLHRLSADGGGRSALTVLDQSRNERTHRFPSFTPDGRAVLFIVQTTDSPDYYDDARIDAVWLDSGDRVTVYEGGASMAVAVDRGHLVYAREGTLFAAPLDFRTLQLTGDGIPMVNQVVGEFASGVVHFVVSPDGTLVYEPGGARRRTLLRIDRTGETPLSAPPGDYNEVSVSPDGTRVALAMVSEGGGYDIWTYRLPDGPFHRVTAGGVNRSPRWFSDSAHLAHVAIRPDGRTALLRQHVDGGAAETLREFETGPAFLDDVSPDDRWLAVRSRGAAGEMSLSVMATSGNDVAPVTRATLDGRYGVFSPDGQWLAYEARGLRDPAAIARGAIGQHVSLIRLDGSSQMVAGPGNSAGEPRWSSSALFFISAGRLMSADYRAGANPQFGEPIAWPASVAHDRNEERGLLYDVSPDGHWVVDVRLPLGGGTELVVVRNWLEELKRVRPAP